LTDTELPKTELPSEAPTRRPSDPEGVGMLISSAWMVTCFWSAAGGTILREHGGVSPR